MLNYWWFTNPKRKLNSIPEVLAAFAETEMQEKWFKDRETHYYLDDALEDCGLKREGEERNKPIGVGSAYKAWLESLGLLFIQRKTNKWKFTLAGEAILNGESPIKILTNQILKYQFPSACSLRANVSERFKVHPFWLLLKLLANRSIEYLTQDEIAKVVITEAENETDRCYRKLTSRIMDYRFYGDRSLDKDFAEKYAPSKGDVNSEKPFAHLQDIANTIMNWLEYTQFVARDGKKVFILPERMKEVSEIVSEHIPFITRQKNYELFQRRYGLDSTHIKDTRNLLKNSFITDFMVAEIMVKRMFISLALKEPICGITDDVVWKIYEQSGIRPYIIAEVLEKNFPNGAIEAFMPNYFEMAFMGFKQSREFTEATATIFRDVFNFNSTWLGSDSSGKDVPDILLVSDKSGFQAVIETKASSKYTLPSTHRDKMIEHYLPEIKDSSNSDLPLGFFSYIAGGFSYTVSRSLNEIASASSVNGSAMPISVFISKRAV